MTGIGSKIEVRQLVIHSQGEMMMAACIFNHDTSKDT